MANGVKLLSFIPGHSLWAADVVFDRARMMRTYLSGGLSFPSCDRKIGSDILSHVNNEYEHGEWHSAWRAQS